MTTFWVRWLGRGRTPLCSWKTVRIVLSWICELWNDWDTNQRDHYLRLLQTSYEHTGCFRLFRHATLMYNSLIEVTECLNTCFIVREKNKTKTLTSIRHPRRFCWTCAYTRYSQFDRRLVIKGWPVKIEPRLEKANKNGDAVNVTSITLRTNCLYWPGLARRMA